MSYAGLGSGAVAKPRSADIGQDIVRLGERALRLRFGALHLELRLRREPAVGVAPEFSDVELERLARRSRQTYASSWEAGMAMTYGGCTGPR